VASQQQATTTNGPMDQWKCQPGFPYAKTFFTATEPSFANFDHSSLVSRRRIVVNAKRLR